MSDKEKPAEKPIQQLSEDETSKVVGGLTSRGGAGGIAGGGTISNVSDSCKETTDTGMMGCPG